MIHGDSKGDQLAGKKLYQLGDDSTVNHYKEDLSPASAGGYTVYLIDGENLKEQIRSAEIHAEEIAKLRETIHSQIREKMETSQTYSLQYEYLKGEDRLARKLVRSKRKEIDCVSSFVNKAKNALAVEDVNSRIYNIEHMIHGLPLMEEKQLLYQIKQLKLLRRQLSLNLGNQDEIKLALQHKEQSEKRLKMSRKELDALKNILLNIEVAAVQTGRKFVDENKKLKELQAQFRTVDHNYQAAFAEWQRLNKQLQNQVDKTGRDFWDMNEGLNYEFSTGSRVHRMVTSNVHSLDPDQEPSILPNHVHERVSAPSEFNSPLQTPALEIKQKTTDIDVLDEEIKKSQRDKTKLTIKSDVIVVDNKANDLKEKMQMEEHQAYEGKKWQAKKKPRMREELKIKKEAEHKEKEREKRLRRKKNKTAAMVDISDIKCCTAVEADKEIPSLLPQKKIKPIFPPLRCNRNKKLCKQWIMWFSLMCLVFIVFWPGNIGDAFRNTCINWH